MWKPSQAAMDEHFVAQLRSDPRVGALAVRPKFPLQVDAVADSLVELQQIISRVRQTVIQVYLAYERGMHDLTHVCHINVGKGTRVHLRDGDSYTLPGEAHPYPYWGM